MNQNRFEEKTGFLQAEVERLKNNCAALYDMYRTAEREVERLQKSNAHLLEQWKGFLMDTDQYCDECLHHETPQCLPECEWGKLWQWRGIQEEA